MTREELLKVAKPILFSTEMVKAILDDRKTATRRVVKLDLGLADTDKNDKNYLMIPDEYGDFHSIEDFRKYKTGDILWVRETFCEVPYEYECVPIDGGHITMPRIAYRADSEVDYTGIWKPSIFMPKAAARIFLKVTADSRFERLQEITEEEAKKEGCFTFEEKISNENLKNSTAFDLTAKDAFKELWDSLNAKRGYPYKSNPWVEVVEFERVKTSGESETSLISKRKLQPNITIGFAEKSPRFVAKGRHTVVFEEYKEKEKTK